MKYRLTADQLMVLEQNVFLPLKESGASAYIFGSRARGTQQKFSDIDILVESTLDLSQLVSRISESIESGNFPLKIDIVESKNLAES